jgi:catechol 2,3-dioxygenase-like lactoylglutathione lyase family enzyme
MTVNYCVPILKVRDMRRSEDFYCTVLGFQKHGEYASAKDGPVYTFLSRGGARLHLSSFPGDGVFGTAVYFDVDDVDALYAAFLSAGLDKAELEPTDQTWDRREIYVLDPDRNCLRFGAPLK